MLRGNSSVKNAIIPLEVGGMLQTEVGVGTRVRDQWRYPPRPAAAKTTSCEVVRQLAGALTPAETGETDARLAGRAMRPQTMPYMPARRRSFV